MPKINVTDGVGSTVSKQFKIKTIYSWMPKADEWAINANRNQYWTPSGFTEPDALVTDRNSKIFLPDVDGVYQEIDQDKLSRTNRGLYVNGQVTALNVNGNNPQAGVGNGWQTVGGITVTPAPDEDIFRPVYVPSNGGVNDRYGTSSTVVSDGSTTFAVKIRFDAGQDDSGWVNVILASGSNAIVRGPRGEAATGGQSVTIVSQSEKHLNLLWTPNATSAGSVRVGPYSDQIGKDIKLLGIDITDVPTDAWVSGLSPLLASDIRAVQGVRPSNGQPEPVPGWEEAGLDNAFGILASVKIDRLNAASPRTIAAVGIDAQHKMYVYLDTDNRIKAQLLKLGPELNTGVVNAINGSWTQSGGVITAPGSNGADNVSYNLAATFPAQRRFLVLCPSTMPSLGFYLDFGPGTGASQIGGLSSTTTSVIMTSQMDVSVIRAGRWVGAPTGTIGPLSVREIVTHFTLQSGPITDLGNYNIAAMLNPGSNSLAVTGVAGDANSDAETLPAGATTLRVGSDFGVLNPFNGWIHSVHVCKPLTDQEMLDWVNGVIPAIPTLNNIPLSTNTKPTISGTCDFNTTKIYVYVDGIEAGTALGDENDTWRCKLSLAPGTYQITARSESTIGKFSDYSEPITLVIADELSISGTPETYVQEGVEYSFTPTTTGGVPPYTYTLEDMNTMPDGMSIDPNTGELSGYPNPGIYEGIVIEVEDQE